MMLRRLRYWVDSVRYSYTERVRLPAGWAAYCGGRVEFSRFRAQGWLWIARRAWRIAGQDAQLDGHLDLGGDR